MYLFEFLKIKRGQTIFILGTYFMTSCLFGTFMSEINMNKLPKVNKKARNIFKTLSLTSIQWNQSVIENELFKLILHIEPYE